MPAARSSLLVNDAAAVLDHRDGSWALGCPAGNTILKPGLNRVVIRAFDGKDGTGTVVNQTQLDVWNDDGHGDPAVRARSPGPTRSATPG